MLSQRPPTPPELLARLGATPVVPWANGGGRTRELLHDRAPCGSTRLRLSVAEIASPGPFSRLPELLRTLVPLSGANFTLAIEGRVVVASPYVPLHFPGGADVTVRAVGAASQVFNVMASRAWGCVALRVEDATFAGMAGTPTYVFVCEGRFRQAHGGAVAGAGDLLGFAPRAITRSWAGTGRALVIRPSAWRDP